MDSSSQNLPSLEFEQLEEIPDGQGALLLQEAEAFWLDLQQRNNFPMNHPQDQSVELPSLDEEEEEEEEAPWWIEGAGNFQDGRVSPPMIHLPILELRPATPVDEENEGLDGEDAPIMEEENDNYIPDGQEEWLAMEFRAGRNIDNYFD